MSSYANTSVKFKMSHVRNKLYISHFFNHRKHVGLLSTTLIIIFIFVAQPIDLSFIDVITISYALITVDGIQKILVFWIDVQSI